MKKTFANLNPHHIGLCMRESVRQALIEIRRQRLLFTSKVKIVNYKTEEDLVTSADIAAQKIFLKIISENFPEAGIIAEEDFSRKCSNKEHNYFFTIDPLDGTKAYGRKQSHGVSSMISFVFDGVVEGITIGDPNTLELFHSRPGSNKVHRIYDFDNHSELTADVTKPLQNQYLQLRIDPRKLSEFSQKMTDPYIKTGNLFKSVEVIGGSIGSTFSRLWKGEVAAVLLDNQQPEQTPWDSCPVMGMSQKMGFLFFEITEKDLVPFTFIPSEQNVALKNEVLVIHKGYLPALNLWAKNQIS